VAVSGALAGAVGLGTLTPVYVVKVQLQLPRQDVMRPFTSPVDCAAHNFRHYGFSGLYAGFMPGLVANSVGFSVRFITYSKCTEAIARLIASESEQASSSVQVAAQLLGGGLAGMVTWASAYPLDVVMSRMQAEGAKTQTNRRAGALRTITEIYKAGITEIYKAGGGAAFFKGLGPCLLRAFPVNAVIFLTFEQSMKML